MATEYSYSELMQMQDKAIERVREMQERARRTMEENPIDLPHTDFESTEQEEAPPVPEKIPQAEKQRPKSSPLAGLKMNLDKDKATVLPLLLLLMNEGCDNLLLLALLYIMA